MNRIEINAYIKGFEACLDKMLDILCKNSECVSPKMIKEIDEYYKSFEYESGAMLDGQGV